MRSMGSLYQFFGTRGSKEFSLAYFTKNLLLFATSYQIADKRNKKKIKEDIEGKERGSREGGGRREGRGHTQRLKFGSI